MARPSAAPGTGERAPHLVAALAHGIGVVLGQVAVDARSNEIPAVRELLKAFTDLAGAVITAGALHTQSGTAQAALLAQQGWLQFHGGPWWPCGVPSLVYQPGEHRRRTEQPAAKNNHVWVNGCGNRTESCYQRR